MEIFVYIPGLMTAYQQSQVGNGYVTVGIDRLFSYYRLLQILCSRVKQAEFDNIHWVGLAYRSTINTVPLGNRLKDVSRYSDDSTLENRIQEQFEVYCSFCSLITLVNKILAHERFIVFLTQLFTLNPNMQSKFFHHPQFLYNGLLNY